MHRVLAAGLARWLPAVLSGSGGCPRNSPPLPLAWGLVVVTSLPHGGIRNENMIQLLERALESYSPGIFNLHTINIWGREIPHGGGLSCALPGSILGLY